MSETLTISAVAISASSSPAAEAPPSPIMPPPIPANYQPQLTSSPVSLSPSPPPLPSSSSPPPPLSQEELDAKKALDRLNKRSQVIKEIKTTERDYTNNINRIVSDYMAPLRQSADKYGINTEQITTVFKNIDVIASFHTILNTDLMECDTPLAICQCLLKRADFLQFYSDYINNFELANKCLAALKENRKFQKFLSDKRSESSNGLDLSSLLIMPVQRIPRYELLLKELKRNLDSDTDSEEMTVLDKALAKIVTNAQNVNEKKRKFERESGLKSIEKRVGNLDTIFPNGISNGADHRRLIKEGVLKAKKSTFGMKVRYCYLLNDVFIITSDKKYKSHLGVYELHASIVNHSEEKDNGGNSDDTGIELVHPACKSMVLYADTQYEQRQWLQSFNEAHRESLTLNADINAMFQAHTGASTTASRHDRSISVSSIGGHSTLSVFPHYEVHSPLSPLSPHPNGTMEDVEEEEVSKSGHEHDNDGDESSVSVNDKQHLDEEKEIGDDDHASIAPVTSSTIVNEDEKEIPSAVSTSTSSPTIVSQHGRSQSKIIKVSGNHSRVTSAIVTPCSPGSPVMHSRRVSTTVPSVTTTTSTAAKSRTHSRRTSTVSNTTEVIADKDNFADDIPTLTMLGTAATTSSAIRPATVKPLSSLSRNDVTSLKKMKNPPVPVKLAIESLAILLDLQPGEPIRGEKKPNYWQPVQALLVKPTFIKELLTFESENRQVSSEGLAILKTYVHNEQLKPESVSSCSQPTGILWHWVRQRYAAQTGEPLPFSDAPVKTEKKGPVTAKVNTGIAHSTKSQAPSRAVSRKVTPTHTRQSSLAVTPAAGHSRRVSKIEGELVSARSATGLHSIKPINIASAGTPAASTPNTARNIGARAKTPVTAMVATSRIPVTKATPRVKLGATTTAAAKVGAAAKAAAMRQE